MKTGAILTQSEMKGIPPEGTLIDNALPTMTRGRKQLRGYLFKYCTMFSFVIWNDCRQLDQAVLAVELTAYCKKCTIKQHLSFAPPTPQLSIFPFKEKVPGHAWQSSDKNGGEGRKGHLFCTTPNIMDRCGYQAAHNRWINWSGDMQYPQPNVPVTVGDKCTGSWIIRLM